MDQIHTFYNFAGQARIRKEQFRKINEILEKTKKEDEMSYKKSGKKNVIKHTCNKINKDGKCRFAIDLSELKKPGSESNLYFLICKDLNKGYLVPSGLVKKYSKNFRGSGRKFPFSINPSTNRIEYGGESENINRYCKSGKSEIESTIDKSAPKSPGQMGSSAIDTLGPMFKRELEDLIEFIEGQLKFEIIKEVKSLKIFNESDLQCSFHRHLNTCLTSKSKNWLIKNSPKLYDLRSPDILIYFDEIPIVLFELKCKIWAGSKHFPENNKGELKDDKRKIVRFKRKYKTIQRAYIFAVFDAYHEDIHSFQRNTDRHYYRDIYINVGEFDNYDNWKHEWVEKRDLY